jgi:hypothetical protein
MCASVAALLMALWLGVDVGWGLSCGLEMLHAVFVCDSGVLAINCAQIHPKVR